MVDVLSCNSAAENNPGSGARKSARRGALAIFAMLARSLQQISTFVVTLLAARFLIPAEYGIYSLGIVFITLIQTLTYTGFYHFIVTSKQDDESLLATSFWMITGLAGGSALLLMLAAYPIAWIYDAPELGPVLLLLALIQPLAGAGAWFSAVLLRRGAMNLHFSIMFLQNLIAMIGGALLLWMWQSLFALVAFRYLRVVSGAVLYLILCRDRPALRFDRVLAREATSFSGGLYGARFLNFLSRYSGDLMLGLLFTTAEAGLYRFGSRVAGGAVDVISQPIRSFALTQFGAAARNDRPLEGPLRRFTGSIVLLTGGTAAVVIVLARDAIVTLFDPAYLSGLPVTYAMAVSGVIGVGTLILEPALAARAQTGRIMMFNAVWAVISIAGVFASAPFGLTAMAVMQTVLTALATLSALWMIRRATGIPVGGALRALLGAGALSVGYGLVLAFSWPHVAALAGLHGGGWGLALGVAWAAILAVPTLVLGRRIGVFTLRIFAG